MSGPDAPPTLWHGTDPAPPARAAFSGTGATDLAIIGGGFTGLSAALHAAARGLSVTLVEARRIAHGASGRNAGFVVPNFAKVDPDLIRARLGPERGERLIAFAASSADLVFDLIRRHDIACDARQGGWFQPAPTRAGLPAIAARQAAWAARGRPAALLTGEEIAAATGVRGYAGGWIDRSGGVIHPVAYARGLAAAAEAAGARLHEESPVLRLSRTGGLWHLVTPGGEISARRVILATNAMGGGLVPQVARSLFPLRVFQIATAPLPEAMRGGLMPFGQCLSDTRRNLFTYRFDAGGRLISGGMAVFGPGAEARLPRIIHRRMAEELARPDLPPVAFAWSGLAAVMPDFMPYIAEVAEGLVAPIACNGRGIAMTTRLGPELAGWAAGTPSAELAVPAGPPRPIRFHFAMRHAPNALLPLSILRDRLDARADGRASVPA